MGKLKTFTHQCCLILIFVYFLSVNTAYYISSKLVGTTGTNKSNSLQTIVSFIFINSFYINNKYNLRQESNRYFFIDEPLIHLSKLHLYCSTCFLQIFCNVGV